MFRLLFLLATVHGAVVTLNEANFDTVVNGDSNVLVEFYAPWCGHCKSLAPEWQIAGNTFDGTDGVVIAAVDATENGALASKFGIKGYPTIKFFPKGSSEPEEYTGGRTADTIVSWVNNKVGTSKKVKKTPSAVVDLTYDNFDAVVLNPDNSVLVEFYAPWCGHCKELAPKYETLAGIFAGEKNIIIAKVDATEYGDLADRYDVSGYPTLKFFGAGASKAAVPYDSQREVVDLVEFLNENTGSLRLPSGGLVDGAGRISVFDEIIQSAANQDLSLVAALKEASTVGEFRNDFVDIYVSAASKVAEKGGDYVEKEISRLNGMIKNANVTPEKKTSFTYRKNILEAFRK